MLLGRPDPPIGGENTKRFVPHIAIKLHAGSVEETLCRGQVTQLNETLWEIGLNSLAEIGAWLEPTKRLGDGLGELGMLKGTYHKTRSGDGPRRHG